MKKGCRFWAILISMIVCCSLTGCGGEGKDSRKTLVFWHSWGGSVEKTGLEAMVKAYNDSQSTYFVKAQYIADMESKNADCDQR